jgi:hypothetical protein
MKDFRRSYPLFSLCGLNCGLCPMHVGHYCPGCGGGAGNKPCAIVRCSRQHGEAEYCYLCEAFPCEKYDGSGELDSFITYRNRMQDFERARRGGLEAYQAELAEKIIMLKFFLDTCNDGRRKSFFCLAVNLLDLQDVESVAKQMAAEPEGRSLKEKAALAVSLFEEAAAKRNIELKLRKKS